MQSIKRKSITAMIIMKKLLFAAMLLLSTVANAQKICGVYVNQVEDMYEDQYLVIEQDEKGKLSGYYYGTTDDFDEVREGYRPGFFVAELKDIKSDAKSLDFSVEVQTEDLFSLPVPLNVRSSRVASKFLKPWTVYLSGVKKRISFHCLFNNGSLIYQAGDKYSSKTFVKVTDVRILNVVSEGKVINWNNN